MNLGRAKNNEFEAFLRSFGDAKPKRVIVTIHQGNSTFKADDTQNEQRGSGGSHAPEQLRMFPGDDDTQLLPHTEHFRFLLALFMDARTLDGLIGDLEERHVAFAKKHDANSANCWFRRQLMTSLPPLAWAQFKRTFGVNKLVDWFLKIRS